MGSYLSHLWWHLASVLACCLLMACASTPHVQPADSSKPRYSLAIFPWHLSPYRIGESDAYGRQALIDALKTADFSPVYSYYRFRGTPRIPKSMYPELKTIWADVDLPPSTISTRRSISHPSDLGPNLEPAYRLGQQLDVDAVLMYAMDPRSGYDFMWVYLLDVRQRRRYVRDGAVWYYEWDGTRKIEEMTRQVFANFIRDQSAK